jgi:molecular chaperone GrpE
MSESTSKKERKPEPEPEQDARGTEGPGHDGGSGEQKELTVEEERDTYLANWQRALADYQNLRKRTLTDIENARRNAKQPLFDGMLLVLDNLEMALASLASNDEKEENIRLGVELTRTQLLQLLASEGVHPVPAGGAFNPAIHEAVATVTDAELGPGQVVETVRSGYTWGERVLRFAQVKVTSQLQDTGNTDQE